MKPSTIAIQIHHEELKALSLISPSCLSDDLRDREDGILARELSQAEALVVLTAIETVLGSRELWAESRHGAFHTYTVEKARSAIMAGNTRAYSPSGHLNGMSGRLS